MIKNVGKYFYRYVLGYRYDYEVINYFNDPYRNAIKTLYQEGYDVEEEYKRLFREYESRHSPLNFEEISYFFSEQMRAKNMNSELEIRHNLKSKTKIININSFILMIHAKSNGLERDYKDQIKMLSMRSEELSNQIQRINPIYNAVIIRKLARLLEEKLILTYKEFFDVQNVYPKTSILTKYKDFVNKLEIEDKSEIIKKIDNLLALKPPDSKKNENEKIKPKIKYLANNNITKIERIFRTIRFYCNSIIHFKPNKEISFDLDESLFKSIPKETEEIKDDKNIITFETEEKEESYNVSVSTIVDYISNANIPNEILNKLSELKNDYDTQFSSVINLLQKEDLYKKLNSFNLYERAKEDILSDNDFVQNLMEKIKVPEFIKNFKKKEIKNIMNFIHSNKYNLEKINLSNNCEKKEKEHLSKLNKELKKLDIYSRIKFNLTFERDLDLLELNNELEKVISAIKEIDNFLEQLHKLKSTFGDKFKEVQNELSLINNCLIVFDNSKIFHEISIEEFAKCLKEKFNNDTVDLFAKEMNNVYLYIYFIKKGIFIESAYKSIIESSDDSM